MKRRSSSPAARAVSAALGGALWLVPSVARAQSERPVLALDWLAPGECPQQARARRLVADYLGERELARPRVGQRVLEARAAIRQRNGRWELQLETSLDGQPGERMLAAGTCADVADAAALVLAFAIDPGAALRHGAATPEPAKAALPAPPPRPTPTWLGVSASVRGDLGALPGLSVGASLGLSLQHGAWSGALVGSGFGERAKPAAERPTAGGEFSMWAVAVAPCWSPAFREALRVRACLPLELQRVQAAGYGVDVPGESTRSELLVGAELTPGLGLSSRLELIAPLGLALALRRPEFYLERIGSVFRASAVQGRVGLGLLARF